VTGIASAVKGQRPEVRVYAAEPANGAPAAASLAADAPTAVEFTRSWVDGAGSREVIPSVWERASVLLDGAFAVGLDDIAAAVRLLAERMRVIAEGAGALAPAVALSGRAGGGTVVAVVSGGNIDFAVLCRILGGESP
jgi:threonine dehydratase